MSSVRHCTCAWRPEGASNAEIDRELTALKRMFSLAVRGGKRLTRPYIPLLKENAARQGCDSSQI
jgi:hypothetical protein